MELFKKLFHRHTWKPVKTVYRYKDYHTGKLITVKRCQCRECGRIQYLHFHEKTIIY